MDFVDEYGTAATAIRTFYAALGDGQGADASAMVVPEKRASPAFSASGLSRFYGSLAQRIRLIDIAQSNASTYLVHYRYATASRACDGGSHAMKLILSRKGFDSAAGKAPSPIVAGRPLSRPLPAAEKSPTPYEDIGLGDLVERVTRGKIGRYHRCHHDPMFVGGE
ncbi:hypothetical protein KXV85_002533, partial [Aspergillus fumigatus]